MPGLAPTRLARMRAHARAIAGLVRSAERARRTPWLDALIGGRQRLPTLAHHPENDVIDRHSGAQFFLHAHDRDTHGFAHFHCFVRLPGDRFGVDRLHITTHVAAVAVDRQGWPVRLIATNQWVTGEFLQPARRTLALLERFRFDSDVGHGEIGGFLQGVLQIHWPELRALLARRDARLRALQTRNPSRNVLLDPRLEIVASRPIDIRHRLRRLSKGRARSA
jgi:hypothetical protein